MKKLSFLVLLLAMSFKLQAQSYTDPVKYNDYIVSLQNEIGQKIIIFNEQVGMEGMDFDGIMPYYNQLLTTTRSCIEKMNKLEAFEKNIELRRSALELMKFYERTISISYMEMINILFKSELDEAAMEKMNTILTKVTDEESGIDKKFKEAQEAFAKKYNIELQENELQKEIDD